MKYTSQKFILFIVVLLGLGAIIAYAIPALATSFGDDVTVTGSLDVLGGGTVNPDQFEITIGDTPIVRLHQNTSGIYPDQIWDISGNEGAFYTRDVTANTYPFLVYTGAPNWSFVVNNSGNVGIGLGIGPIAGQKLSVNGAIGVGADEIPIQETNFGYSSGYKVLRVGLNQAARSLALGVDPLGITGGNFSGAGQILIGNNGILAPDNAGTAWMGVLRATGGKVYVGGSLSSGELAGDGLVVSSGNVGVGKKEPGAKLDVYANSGEVFRVDATGFAYRIIADQSGVYMNGNVGIGTTGPTQKLEVNGALRVAPMGAPANASAGTIYFNASSRHFFGFDGFSWKQLDQ